jgi:hypothetical protein
VPCSTYGRKASCCALLKRCTSSTNRMVWRPFCASVSSRALHRLADVLDAGEHRRERDELGVEGLGHQPRQRRLADARRPPQDHRVRLARLEGQAQRLARPEQMLLPDDLVERARPHRSASGACGFFSNRGHSPRTSAPLGGVKRNCAAAAADCARWLLEGDGRRLAEAVGELHGPQRLAGKADAQELEAGVLADFGWASTHSMPSAVPPSLRSKFFSSALSPASSAAGLSRACRRSSGTCPGARTSCCRRRSAACARSSTPPSGRNRPCRFSCPRRRPSACRARRPSARAGSNANKAKPLTTETQRHRDLCISLCLCVSVVKGFPGLHHSCRAGTTTSRLPLAPIGVSICLDQARGAVVADASGAAPARSRGGASSARSRRPGRRARRPRPSAARPRRPPPSSHRRRPPSMYSGGRRFFR